MNDTRLSSPLLWVAIGCIIQSFLFVRTLDDLKRFLFSLLFCLIGFVPGKHETEYDLPEHIGISLFLFIIAGFFASRQRLLPKINEISITTSTVLFWFIFLMMQKYSLNPLTYLIPLIGTIAVTWVIIPSRVLPPAVQLMLYIWYQCIGLMIIFFQYNSIRQLLDGTLALTAISIPELISTGMVIFSVGIQIVSIVYLIPIPGKHQSMADRKKEVMQYVAELVEKFGDEQYRWQILLLMITAYVVAFIIHIRTGLLSDVIFINLLLLTVPVITAALRPIRIEADPMHPENIPPAPGKPQTQNR